MSEEAMKVTAAVLGYKTVDDMFDYRNTGKQDRERDRIAAVIAAAMAERDAEIARLREALSPMIDVVHAYAEYISQVPSAELERHPYLPGLEQEIDAARQALETPHDR